MPQIANQDYKIIAPTPGRPVNVDAAALGELAKALLNGTIYDCIVISPLLANSEDTALIGCVSKVRGVFTLGFINPDDFSIGSIEILYTPDQYQGLAAIQAEVDRIDDAVSSELPIFRADSNGLLYEENSGYQICTPEGYWCRVTIENDKIASIKASDNKIEDDFIAISIEDAQKLIGLPCTTA